MLASLLFGWLRHRVRAVEQENRNLLVGLLADIHRPVVTGTRLLPIDLARRDFDALDFASVAVLNRQGIPAQHHCDSMEGIAMPRHGLAGSEAEAAHHRGSAIKQDFVGHGSSRKAGA